MMVASSSGENDAASSSFGSTLSSRRIALPTALSRTSRGRTSRTKAASGGTSSTDADSGPAMAMFLGTISPMTMCRNTTIDRAIAKAIGCSSPSGTWSACRPSSIRWATAGSATAPRPSEHRVMPSWQAASMVGS